MEKEMLVYLNGEFVPETEARVNVMDHGFLYGDGVFEGIRAYNKRIFKLHEHMDRIYTSADLIHLNIPIEKHEFTEKVIETCRVNRLTDAYIRPLVTRGVGTFGIDPKSCSESTVIIIARPFPSMFGDKCKKGLSLITSDFRRIPPQCLSPNIKSMNYLNNILAKVEANEHNADDALMLDIEGHASEASASNLFIVKDKILITPPTTSTLIGVTRATVLELAEQANMKTMISVFGVPEIYDADEIFITGTAAEIAPIVNVDGKRIGNGKPGKLTERLISKFRKHVRSTGVEIYPEH